MRGKNPTDNLNNIEASGAARLSVTRAKLRRGSSGLYINSSPATTLRFIAGEDFRGPYPRGQLVQFLEGSDNSSIEDFSVVNPKGAWTEDNINILRAKNVVVRRGLIDGNNSPSGNGVMFDGETSTGLVEDVDAIRMGNGCFCSERGAAPIIFRRTRCRDSICGILDGRDAGPLSGGRMWLGDSDRKDGGTGHRIEESAWAGKCTPNYPVYPTYAFDIIQISEKDFTPRAPIDLSFCWD